MRWLIALFSVFLIAGAAAAQVQVGQVAPIPYGFSNSVIDRAGRLVLFDITYDYPPVMAGRPIPVAFPPTMKTRVTIVGSDGIGKSDAQYEGAFQVVGVGRYAVYVLVNEYGFATTSTQTSIVFTRRLVALGPAFPMLPSLDVPIRADVRVSPVGDDGAPDSIAFVDSPATPVILRPADAVAAMPAVATQPRTVQMFTSDGKSFTPLTPKPIPVP